MADDKLKTGPKSPSQDCPNDAPVEEAPSMQEPPVPDRSGSSGRR